MVHLEVTPARAILDMIDHVPFRPDDVFYDIGSGLGHVALLVAWLTGITVKGIEIDPGYCQKARQLAVEFGVRNVDFVTADARTAVYDDGTIFFMFTPFTGQMLQTVLARLAVEARERPITLCTYGTVTHEVAQQPWLSCLEPERLHVFKLCVFSSGR
jgi:SAM-dependent methyltransferase